MAENFLCKWIFPYRRSKWLILVCPYYKGTWDPVKSGMGKVYTESCKGDLVFIEAQIKHELSQKWLIFWKFKNDVKYHINILCFVWNTFWSNENFLIWGRILSNTHSAVPVVCLLCNIRSMPRINCGGHEVCKTMKNMWDSGSLTAASMKITAVWDVALCSLIEVTLMMEAVHTSEALACFNETIWCYSPEGCNFWPKIYLESINTLWSGLFIAVGVILHNVSWCAEEG
jgi:hypothetical protein